MTEDGILGAKPAEEALNRATVLACVGGNVQLLEELVELFLDDCPQWMAKIAEAIRQGNAAGLRFAAHLLRGSVGNFGKSAAYEAAREFEATARAEDLTCAADAYTVLEEAIGQFQAALAGFARKSVPGAPDLPAVGEAVTGGLCKAERERQP